MTYLHMGINMGHDRSVAVVQDGQVKVAIEQERLDRIKHSVGFMYQAPGEMRHIQVPGECIRYCLDMLDVPLSEISSITANMPGIDYAPDIMRGKFSKDIADRVQIIPSHHLAHAYTAYWPSGFDEALVLVADASGSTLTETSGWQTESYSLYTGRGTKLEMLHSERVQAHLAQLSTLGFVYEYISRKAEFFTRVNAGLSFPEAGKLMGLAAYGGPQINWETWLHTQKDSTSLSISAYDIFLEVAALEKRYDQGHGKPYFRPWLVDLAYKVQAELEDALTHIVATAQAETGLNKLCLAGGVALNSVANYQVLMRCKLDDIFIFPAAADNGIAAGCALWAYDTIGGGTERPKLNIATLGRTHGSDEIEQALAKYDDLVIVEEHGPETMPQKVAEALADGSIVARFEGGCEYGPRALGHRSILADPVFLRMKDVVNARVKFREAFRPFAPFVPLDRANEVFELEAESPFMLLVAKIREEFHEVLPAITHEDGTGRVQTCTSEANPFFYNLCLEIDRLREGPPVLLNTSFNVAGQPIVETPEEAIATFLRTDIDYLALENKWIRRRHEPVKSYESHVKDLPKEAMPHGLEPEQPSVRPLMDELDAALFHGAESSHWTHDEIQELAAEGGKFKETSRLYPDSGYLGALETQIAKNTVLLLNPKGTSLLVDQTERQPSLSMDQSEVQLLLALRTDPGEIREALRRTLGLTPFELHQKIDKMMNQVARFTITCDHRWFEWSNPEDSPLEAGAPTRTFAAFEDPEFHSWRSLETFHATLSTLGYSESAILALLKVDSLQQIEPTHLHYYAQHTLPETPLADLIRLFLLRGSLPQQRLDSLLGPTLIERLIQLGVLSRHEDTIHSTVDLYCSGGMLFATDHRYMLKEGDALDEDPVMYIGMDSHGLVQTAPRESSQRLLDLCCGSGVQGLVGSRYAADVVAVDLNPRAIRFARFNAQLNGVRRYEVREGSLYDCVKDEQFDVILANPPFVPSPEMGLKFRDGGSNGEAILREIIKGAADHLTDDGRLCIVTDLVDIGYYPEKLQSWWQASTMEALVLTTADRDEILFSVPHCHAPFGQSLADYNAELSRWVQNYRDAKLSGVNFGYILIQNGPAWGGNAVTMRTVHNPAKPIHRQVSDWFEQRAFWHSEDSANFYLGLHPDLRMRIEHSPGRENPGFEVMVPSNDFFTTYVVGETIYKELQRIYDVEPRLGSRLTPVDQDWLEDLHRKGILRLRRYRKGIETKALTRSERDSLKVEEMATKTTPTCLSSYLS